MMLQAKIGNENFENSLQALRGYDSDISLEIDEVKVIKDCAPAFIFNIILQF